MAWVIDLDSQFRGKHRSSILCEDYPHFCSVEGTETYCRDFVWVLQVSLELLEFIKLVIFANPAAHDVLHLLPVGSFVRQRPPALSVVVPDLEFVHPTYQKCLIFIGEIN